MPSTNQAAPSPIPGLVQMLVVALLGLVLLPTVISSNLGLGLVAGSMTVSVAQVWLGLAVVLLFWLLLVVIALSGVVGVRLTAFRAFLVRDTHHSATTAAPKTRLVSALALMIVYVLLAEAIVRHPLASVLGVYLEPSLVQALVATIALALVLIFVTWLYGAARSFVKDVAWYVLDGVVATSGSDRVQSFYQVDESLAASTPPAVQAEENRPTTVSSTRDEATVVTADQETMATQVTSSGEDESTVWAGNDTDATQLTPDEDSEATQLSPTDDETLTERTLPGDSSTV